MLHYWNFFESMLEQLMLGIVYGGLISLVHNWPPATVVHYVGPSQLDPILHPKNFITFYEFANLPCRPHDSYASSRSSIISARSIFAGWNWQSHPAPCPFLSLPAQARVVKSQLQQRHSLRCAYTTKKPLCGSIRVKVTRSAS